LIHASLPAASGRLEVLHDFSERVAERIDAPALSHGMRVADALTGATAIVSTATLITANALPLNSP